jgi:hypothetical protein
VHNHGLNVSYLRVGDIERWAQYVRSDGGSLRDSDGHWLDGLRDLHEVIAAHEVFLRDVTTTFQYLPRVPSTFAQNWASTAERAVDRAHVQLGMDRVWDDIVSTDKDADMVDVTLGNPTNPET